MKTRVSQLKIIGECTCKKQKQKRTQKLQKEEKTFQKTTNNGTKINKNMKRLSGWIFFKSNIFCSQEI